MEYTGKLYGRIGRKYFETGKTSEDYDKLLEENKKLKQQINLSLSGVRIPLPDDALHFAEWMDIVCYRDGKFKWRYKADNFTKKYTTTEMFTEWLKLTNNED